MTKPKFIVAALILCLALNTSGQMRHFSIYVENKSGFDFICEGMPKKGEGVFTKYTPTLKKQQRFAFIIESNKNILPKGVEGTIRFRLNDPKYDGYVEVYFNNPIIGSPEFKLNVISFPFGAEEFPIGQINDVVALPEKAVAIRIYVDTTKRVNRPTPLPVKGSSNKPDPKNPTTSSGNVDEPIPDVINFAWEVKQRKRKTDDDDNDNGKAYEEITYLFTADGKYAAIKAENKSFSLMIYSPKGHTWIMDDDKKTITVMSMPKIIGEGAAMGKAIAEDIKKSPLQKDEDETYTITKTGKTKKILGYTAEEYVLRMDKTNATKNTGQGASFWYTTVPFDPVKIYTMGAGRPADLTNPALKNNIVAIPVLNKNYLLTEIEAGNIKGMETISIAQKFTTIRTAGYTIKMMKGFLKD